MSLVKLEVLGKTGSAVGIAVRSNAILLKWTTIGLSEREQHVLTESTRHGSQSRALPLPQDPSLPAQRGMEEVLLASQREEQVGQVSRVPADSGFLSHGEPFPPCHPRPRLSAPMALLHEFGVLDLGSVCMFPLHWHHRSTTFLTICLFFYLSLRTADKYRFSSLFLDICRLKWRN